MQSTSTRADVVARVLADRFDATTYTDRVIDWLNEAAGLVARRCDLPGLLEIGSIDVEAGTYRYDLPADHARTVYLLPTTGDCGELRFVENPLDVLRYRSEMDTPTRYSLQGESIILGPTPNGPLTFEHAYQRLPVRAGGDLDHFELPEDYVDVLVAFAVSRTWRDEDDLDAAARWMADFEAGVTGVKVDLRNPEVDGPVQVPGTF